MCHYKHVIALLNISNALRYVRIRILFYLLYFVASCRLTCINDSQVTAPYACTLNEWQKSQVRCIGHMKYTSECMY